MQHLFITLMQGYILFLKKKAKGFITIIKLILNILLYFQYILGGVSYAAERFDPKFFEKFRSINIVELAIDYAQVSFLNRYPAGTESD